MKTYDELKALIERRGTHPVFGGAGETDNYIEQNPHELATFLVHMQQLGVQSVLEIGTGWRAGLARFLHDDMGWSVTSVDIRDYGHKFDGITFVQMVAGESAEAFGQYDLVILDADHRYHEVKHQHGMWQPNAIKVLAFHDIAGLRDCEGVKQYWDEISGGAGYYEIIADTPERGGIGYIVLAEVEARQAIPNIVAHGTGLDGEPITLKVEAIIDVPKPSAKKPRARKPAAKKPTTTNKKPAVKK